ncbi:DUF2958 domain-containing protein [Sphingobium sp. LMC3-1-1.1]|uniref:DUF2958 domain-containing protein n=1 Tax=Sphingobium sp. LMC3-1-1.1 TaxID=3135241 RepID=UPI0034418C87
MDWTTHIRPTDLQQLIINWEEQQPLKGTRNEQDYKPVVKLFAPAGAMTWLITECNDDGLAFGLADLGFAAPEMGYISLPEIFSVRIGGLYVEQDLFFRPGKTLGQYADEARQKGRIVA